MKSYCENIAICHTDEIENLIPFTVFAFVSSITPGPNNLMILTSCVNFGLRRSLPHALGIEIGFFIMVLSIGLGLEEVFHLYPILYDIMKWLGIIYLLYLTWKITQATDELKVKKPTKPMSFIQAVAFQWVNPKAWMMSIGFFSSYIPRGSSNATILLACLIVLAVNIPSLAFWALSGAKLGKYLKQENYRRIFNYAMAILLLGSIIPILKN